MRHLALLLTTFLACTMPGAHAQSVCASDGQPRPVALLERFINADCEECWGNAAAPRPGHGELALDWIVPGAKGEDAPLSAAANRDGLARLEALRATAPQDAQALTHRIMPKGKTTLRVAHGLPFNDYLAASIALKPAVGGGPRTAWLALVETIAAGTEGTPVERNLVRNLLVVEWDVRKQRSPKEKNSFFEARPMGIPAGAKPERLRVVGWVQDAQGRITSIAQSFCTAAR